MQLENLLSDPFAILSAAANVALVVTVILLLIQHRTKNKITSIDYCRDLLNKIQKDEKLKETNNKINSGMEEKQNYSDHNLDLFLNEYEDLAYFWIEKTVKLEHIIQMHGAVLSKIKKSKRAHGYIKEKHSEDKFFFSSIVRLLKKID